MGPCVRRDDSGDGGVVYSPTAIILPNGAQDDAPAKGSPLLSPAESSPAKTAFVFAGGGSFGAVQVGMMDALARNGVTADMVVGSSVGALNGAFYASDPTVAGVERLANIWRGLRRHDVFPVTWRTLLSF